MTQQEQGRVGDCNLMGSRQRQDMAHRILYRDSATAGVQVPFWASLFSFADPRSN